MGLEQVCLPIGSLLLVCTSDGLNSFIHKPFSKHIKRFSFVGDTNFNLTE